MAVVCNYFIWGLSLLFSPCRLSEFTLAGPLPSQQIEHKASEKKIIVNELSRVGSYTLQLSLNVSPLWMLSILGTGEHGEI